MTFKTVASSVIVGEEIKSSAGDIIGLFLEKEVPKDLSPMDTVKAIKNQGGLVMAPHPFDRLRPSAIKKEALEEVLPYVDLFEVYNSHNLLRWDDKKAYHFCRQHDLVAVAVSDSHTPIELGRTYMEAPEFDGTPQGFKEALGKATLVTRKAHHILRLTSVFVKCKRLFRP